MSKALKFLSVMVAFLFVAGIMTGCKDKKTESNSPQIDKVTTDKIISQKADDSVDPENTDTTKQPGKIVKAQDLYHQSGKVNGIDVSKWQGKIDWNTVKKNGIEFAIIRIGYRGENGVIYKDTYADYNIQQADKAGILVGVYFFSTSVNETEAKQEAEWTTSAIEGYPISYPVVYDCEGFKNSDSRLYSLTNSARTNNAIAFLSQIKNTGYQAMFYAAMNELDGSAYWDTGRLESDFKIWVARYPDITYPNVQNPDYSGKYDLWQYTNMGTVGGIKGNTDMVVSYQVYEKKSPLKSSSKPGTATAPIENNIYTDVGDTVTAKIETNLRDEASTKGNIVMLLKNGTTIKRTGIGTNGWSRLNYNGKIVYAITSYLTTDLSKAPTKQDDGFKEDSGKVTAKDETNLRTTPSVDGKLAGTIKNGEFVTKTGTNPNGWTRLLYNGKTVYAKTSLLTTEVVKKPEEVTPSKPATDDGYKTVSEQVTAKSVTNLRSEPSSKNDDTIVYELKTGEYVTRIGINDTTGWSKLSYNGKTVYAISSYLILKTE